MPFDKPFSTSSQAHHVFWSPDMKCYVTGITADGTLIFSAIFYLRAYGSFGAEQSTEAREAPAATAREMYAKFNDDQRRVFENYDHLNEKPEFTHFYLQGPGSTGKTFLYGALYADVRRNGRTVYSRMLSM